MRLLFLMAGVAALAPAAGGIRPRATAADYPAQASVSAVTIGAALIPSAQVHKIFATDLNQGGYLVFEVSIYPGQGAEIAVSPADFLLRAETDGETVRPADGRSIAGALQRKNTPKQSDVTLYPTATIGYESGGGYDPNTGRQRTSGIYTAAGVGVATGGASGPHPTGTDRDRATMQRELDDKSLAEGKTTAPVAGYLYFPTPSSKSKAGYYELTYYGSEGQIRLRVRARK